MVRGLILGAALLLFAGCGAEDLSLGYTCEDPESGRIGPEGQPDPCHRLEAPGVCAGGELMHWPIQWNEPTWLWFGPEKEAPDCPYGLESTAYEGHADLVAPSVCEACSCEPPTGACGLPSELTASANACGSFPAGAFTSFDAPAPWDGTCDDTTHVPSGKASALTIAALTVKEEGCAAGPPLPAKVVSAHWETFARACDGEGWRPGPVEHSACLPGSERMPPGFRLCASHDGAIDCPTMPGNVFTEPHVFFTGIDDERACSACTCGPPEGSLCTALLSIYEGANPTCSGPATVLLPISSEGPTCVDIQPSGQALTSKSAGQITYVPGACQPAGGQPNGLPATGTEPITFCCRP